MSCSTTCLHLPEATSCPLALARPGSCGSTPEATQSSHRGELCPGDPALHPLYMTNVTPLRWARPRSRPTSPTSPSSNGMGRHAARTAYCSVVHRRDQPRLAPTNTTGRLDVFGGGLGLPADDHQPQSTDVKPDRDHVRGQQHINRMLRQRFLRPFRALRAGSNGVSNRSSISGCRPRSLVAVGAIAFVQTSPCRFGLRRQAGLCYCCIV
jgi:hypothetical protein